MSSQQSGVYTISNQIILKKSSVAGKIPLTTDLAYGELAINFTDGKLYFKNSSNAILNFSNSSAFATVATSGLFSDLLSRPTTLSGYGITDAVSSTTSQTAAYVFAAPSAATGASSFRALVATDIPTLNQSTTGSAATLTTGRTISMSGDVTWTSASFDGSTNVTGSATLATITQSTGSSFVKITLDTKGRVIGNTAVAQSDITGLLGAGSITNTMLANSAVANLSGTNTGDETASTIKTKLGITTLSGSNTGDQTITLTGDATGSGTGSFVVTLANSGVTTGTYTSVTVDAKGRITAGTNPTTLSGFGITDAMPYVTPGTSGNILTSNGTTWVSQAASATLAGITQSTSPYSTAFGYQTGNTATVSGTFNTSHGYRALTGVTTGTDNIAIGYQAGYSRTSGSKAVLIGTSAGFAAVDSDFIIAIGYNAMGALTGTGTNNIAPIAIGRNAMASSTGDNYACVAIGDRALIGQTSGHSNTAIGGNAGFSLTTGIQNVFVGRGAGENVTGSNNTLVGTLAGTDLTSGANNILIGYNATASAATVSNEVTIGNSSNTSFRFWGALMPGGSSAGTSGQVLTSAGAGVSPTWTTVGGGATLSDDTTTNSSYYPVLATVTSGSMSAAKVSSTKFYFNPSTGTLNSTSFNSLSDSSKKTNIVSIENAVKTVSKIEGVEFDWIDTGYKSAGVIAQQLETILPHLVNTDREGLKSVNYDGIIGYLIASVKELSSKIEQMENK